MRVWPECGRERSQPPRCSCYVCTTNARKMRQAGTRCEFHRDGACLPGVRRNMMTGDQGRQGQATQTTPEMAAPHAASVMRGYLPDGLKDNASTKSSARVQFDRSRTLEGRGREAVPVRDRVPLFLVYMCMPAMAVASLWWPPSVPPPASTPSSSISKCAPLSSLTFS